MATIFEIKTSRIVHITNVENAEAWMRSRGLSLETHDYYIS